MIDKVAGAAVQGAQQVGNAPKVQSFGKVMQGAKPQVHAAPKPAAIAPQPPPSTARSQSAAPQQAPRVEQKPKAQAVLNEVADAQAKLDSILKMAESGRTFSPAELLAFQAHAYRASQELDLAGKVVEKATSGVKQTLNTQV